MSQKSVVVVSLLALYWSTFGVASADGPEVVPSWEAPDRFSAYFDISQGGGGRDIGQSTGNSTSAGNFVDRRDLTQMHCPRPDAEIGIMGCREFDQGEPDAPQLSEADILRASRDFRMPRLDVQIQPGERTLVNARTVFFVDPPEWNRSVELLGFEVDLTATPTTYTWHHGDGTSHTTSEPGRPYPAMDVTYRYPEAADRVTPSVDVTYQVRYRIDGGPWQNLSQTLTAAGPAAELEVREAAPVLTKR